MRKAIMISSAAMALLPLAACGEKRVTAENASVAEVAEKVKESGIAGDSFINPGQWETMVEITDVSIPGMPPEMAAQMKQHMAEGHSDRSCVTPEEAKKPREQFFGGEQMKHCKYDRFAFGGGRIDMTMQCAHESGMRQVMEMHGSYSGDAYRMDVQSDATGGQGAMKTMRVAMRISGKRVGACTGKDAS